MTQTHCVGTVIQIGDGGLWSSVFGAITPLVLLFSLWVQKIWADNAARRGEDAKDAAQEAAKAAIQVKQTLEHTSSAAHEDLGRIKQLATQTHTLVNSQRGVILKNMAVLSRSHAVLARKAANLSNDSDDRLIADEAEEAASHAESAYDLHQDQQNIVDSTSK
jgi:hypothetical protein